MTSRDFCYWLQGFFEINDIHTPTSKQGLSDSQVQVIKNHLNLVFYHEINPSYTSDKEEQKKMNKIHNGSETVHNPKAKSWEWEESYEVPHSGHSGNVFPSEENTLYRC